MRLMDNSSSNYRLQDEEIQALLDVFGSKYLAAASAADQISAYYAAKSDKTVGKLSISQGSGSKRYQDLAKQLRYESALFAMPYAGGISVADKASEVLDSDRVAPAFNSEQF